MEITEMLCRRFEEEDSAAFADLFAEDAVYIDSLYGSYKGRGAIRAFHERCHKEAKEYSFLPLNTLVSGGDMVAFEWSFEFISILPLSRGKKVALNGASFLTLREGKIISYREYADSIALLLGGNVPIDKIIKFYNRKYPVG